MRSKIFFIIAATLLCVSCEKTFVMETELEIGSRSETFTATIECDPSTRTSLSDFNSNESFYSLIWSKGDAISISDGAKTAIYTTDDNYSSTAEFIRSEGSISNKASQYTAFYPSTITTSNMVLPATQNYVEDNVENFPMRAVSTSKDLSFKNLCGIIRFSLKSEEIGQISISSISLSADKGMSGTFTVSEDNAAVVSENDGVILSCGVPQSLYRSSTTDFNIIVPKGSYNPP